MTRKNDMVSVLDEIIDGSDDKYEGVMKKHRNHYGQFYNIYKALQNQSNGEVEYVSTDDENAMFKVKGVDIEEIREACKMAPIYESMRSTTIDVEQDEDRVSVNISIK